MKTLFRSAAIAFAAFALTFATSCSEDQTEDITTPSKPTISIENIDIEKGAEFLYSAANVISFTLSTDAAWEITKSEGWFVVSPSSGEAGEDIEISITASLNEQEQERTGSFTITANSGDKQNKIITEQTIEVTQGAFGSASLVLGGDIEDGAISFGSDETSAKSLTIMASYDWEISADNSEWYTLSATSGAANTEATVTVTPNAKNESNEKLEAVLTITATDADYAENTISEQVALVQLFPSDSHAEGFEFFSDDYSWVTANWASELPKYGWPTFKTDGISYNEMNVSGATDEMTAAFDAKGYTFTTEESYIYGRYEGYIKLGKTNNMGAITLPTLAIDENRGATLLVEFDAALYATAKPTIDSGNGEFFVAVDSESGATVGGLTEIKSAIAIDNIHSWKRYAVVVYGATSATKITLGSDQEVTRRYSIDNVKVSRANDSEPQQPEVKDVELDLDFEVENITDNETYTDGKASASGAELEYSIRVNDAWMATPKCEWISIEGAKCGSSSSSIGAEIVDGVLTASATSLPYNHITIKVDRSKVTEVRSGDIEITARGKVIETITIAQEAGSALQLSATCDSFVEFAGQEDVILLADKDAKATMVINATSEWNVISKSEWITLSQESGEADTDVNLEITTSEDNQSFRRNGEFTLELTSGDKTASYTYVVSQNTAAPSNVLCDIASTPVKWNFSTANYASRLYFYDFCGAAADTTPYFNNIPSEQGAGYLSYYHTFDGEDTDCARFIGATGEPYIKGGWKGDNWHFMVYTTGVAADSKVHFTGVSKTSATGPKYWLMEYKDGEEWLPVVEPTQGTTLAGEAVEYTHEYIGTKAITFDYTVTLQNAVANGGTVEFRLTCQALDQANGTGTLTSPNGGTIRFCGEDTAEGASPMIEIVE